MSLCAGATWDRLREPTVPREKIHGPGDEATDRARDLRQQAPIPERLLWGVLRARRLGGLKFRRQVPLGPYFLDYYCAERSFVVELDGMSHAGRAEHDARRQAYIE